MLVGAEMCRRYSAYAMCFGGRQALSAYVSWDGSDWLVHTMEDNPSIIDPTKMRKIGRTTYLVLMVLSRETEY